MHDASARQGIQVTNRGLRGFARFIQIAALDGGARLFDQRSRAIAKGAIVQAALFVLTYALERGLVICHKSTQETVFPAAPFKVTG